MISSVTLSLEEFDKMREEIKALQAVVEEYYKLKDVAYSMIHREDFIGHAHYSDPPYRLYASKKELEDFMNKHFVEPLNKGR